MQLARRVEDSRLTEGQYRGLRDRLSYSSIKQFDNDRKAFFREFVLGKRRREKESVSKTMGSLVHLYLAEQNFDDKFHLMSAVEPKGQMKLLVDNLYDRTMKSATVNEQGEVVVGEKFESIFVDAVNATKYDGDMKEVNFKGKDLEKIATLFADSDAEIYYKEMMAVKGKQVVTVAMVTKGEDISGKIRGHSYTYELANARTRGNELTVFNELGILFEHEGVFYKSMLDKNIIDHEARTIQPVDWKTSWDNEEPKFAYLKFGYYLQGTMYDLAISYWMKDHPELEGYTVLPMKFVFCDTGGWSDPVVLSLTKEDLVAGWHGFKVRGYTYRGLKDLMSDIAWHVETQNWATSKAIFEKKGELLLELDYEK